MSQMIMLYTTCVKYGALAPFGRMRLLYFVVSPFLTNPVNIVILILTELVNIQRSRPNVQAE
jgi:hypothetical protein